MSIETQIDLNEFFNVKSEGKFHILTYKNPNNPCIVYDPGLFHTATCQTALCEIDKSDGQLYYRGINALDKLNDDFLDVAFDIIFSTSELHRNHFKQSVKKHFRLSEEQKILLDAISSTTHPMDVLSIMTTALSGLESNYLENPNDPIEKAAFILASVGITVSYRYSKLNQIDWIEPQLNRPYAEQVIFQMHGGKDPKKIEKLGKIFNTILILHAEHGQNCSATTVRCIASAKGTLYTAVAAGMSAFNGDIHGGASQLVSMMYDEIIEQNLDIDAYIDRKIQNKELLMGFGQRTYNRLGGCWDPRVEKMYEMLMDPEFDFEEIKKYKEVAVKLIQRVVPDSFYKSKNLTPNPDLFNCIFYKLFGAPKTMNTTMLAVGRITGWIANFYEHTQDKIPLSRPFDLLKDTI